MMRDTDVTQGCEVWQPAQFVVGAFEILPLIYVCVCIGKYDV
jgi:hypothetical protein